MLYCHLLIHAEIYIYSLDTYRRNEQQTHLRKTHAGRLLYKYILTSHFIARVRKRLLKVCVWERAGDRTETAILWPPNLWPATLCLSRSQMLNRGPGVHSAGCWLSLLHLISIFSGPQLIRAPSPFGLVWISLPHLTPTVCNSVRSSTQLPLELNWVI